MGKPLDPTPAQVEQLNSETALPAPERNSPYWRKVGARVGTKRPGVGEGRSLSSAFPAPVTPLSSRAYPDFLLRGTDNGLECGFP